MGSSLASSSLPLSFGSSDLFRRIHAVGNSGFAILFGIEDRTWITAWFDDDEVEIGGDDQLQGSFVDQSRSFVSDASRKPAL